MLVAAGDVFRALTRLLLVPGVVIVGILLYLTGNQTLNSIDRFYIVVNGITWCCVVFSLYEK